MNEWIELFEHIEVLMLIGGRIMGCILFLPLVEETKVPKMVIACLSLCMTLPVYFQININDIRPLTNLLSFSIVLSQEVITGLIIGYTAKIFFQIYTFVGSMLSMQGGIAMSTVLDPTGGVQSTTLGRIYTLSFSTIFLVSGGYHWLIRTLIDSFKVIPINQQVFQASLVKTMIEAISEYFQLGVKLSLPILAVIIIIDVTMGILARTVPQMNMFVIGIPLKMIVMFILLLITVPTLLTYSHLIIEALIAGVTQVIQEMRRV